jgi:LPXTG-site transpeptidase (sortase) family protein
MQVVEEGVRELEAQHRKPSGRRLMRRLALAAGAVALLGALALGAVACGSGDDDSGDDGTRTATRTAGPSPTPGQNAGLKTPIAISPGDMLTQADLDARGRGEPGRGDFNGTRLLIPSIEVDATFSIKTVGTDGQMPNPDGPEDVAWYDFSQWPGKGGIPERGGNVVMAAHVDYINYGPAVFWRRHELKAGDRIMVQLNDGTTATYEVEFNKSIDVGAADWSAIVDATADESITLITCGGEFSAGHYTNRQIVWGRRIEGEL